MYSAIILAAGNGTRLKSSVPKVLHKIGGLSLLDHVIRSAKKIEPEKIVVVAKPEFRANQIKYANDIAIAFQKEPKGTGHAVQCGLAAFHEQASGSSIQDNNWIYILYADIPLITSETLRKMSEIAKIYEKTAVVVLAMPSKGSKNLGRLEAGEQKGTVKRIVEAGDSAASESKLLPLCNCGFLVKESILYKFIGQIKPNPAKGEIYITELVRLAYDSGYVCRYYEGNSRELSGANTPVEMAALERNFQNAMREKFMENGVTLTAPETVFFSYDTEIEPDAIIHPFVVFRENVRIKRGAEIGPFCVVEGAKIGTSQIGPFSRIRPGSEINDKAKIGNFVEIKNSVVSEGVKINHLTYIGDSSIGKSTNIGAGTITCNYDGVHKYKTYIGKNVFVGSNSALVAPVNIEDNSTIGAGSVITKDVPTDTLAVARGQQRNIENWKLKSKKERM